MQILGLRCRLEIVCEQLIQSHEAMSITTPLHKTVQDIVYIQFKSNITVYQNFYYFDNNSFI